MKMRAGSLIVVLGVVALFAWRPASEPAVEAAAPAAVTLDADAAMPGVQTFRLAEPGSFAAAVRLADVSDLRAFNLEVTYDQTKMSAPTISVGSDLDRNPDADQSVLASTGRTWACTPPAPSGDIDPNPAVGAALLSCYSSGAMAGPSIGSGGAVIATVQFTVTLAGASTVGLRNVNLYTAGSLEMGSCSPVVVVTATCTGFAIDADSDGDGCGDIREAGINHLLGGQRSAADFYDFYDVTDDRSIDLSDTLLILAHFGHGPNDDLLDDRLDRDILIPAEKWRTSASDTGVDLTDALNNLQSFGDSCVTVG